MNEMTNIFTVSIELARKHAAQRVVQRVIIYWDLIENGKYINLINESKKKYFALV